jgi:hypothetical protein
LDKAAFVSSSLISLGMIGTLAQVLKNGVEAKVGVKDDDECDERKQSRMRFGKGEDKTIDEMR